MQTFGERLLDLRQRKGKIYTQRKVAADLSRLLSKPISHSSYSNWENGVYHPDVHTIKALSQYFNVTTDYLLGADGESSSSKHITPELEALQTLFTNSSYQERTILTKVTESIYDILKNGNIKTEKIDYNDPADAFDAMLDISFRFDHSDKDHLEIQTGLLIEKGKIFEKRGKYNMALSSFEQALETAKSVNPKNDQIEYLYRKLGNMRYFLGYYSYALNLYKEALRHSDNAIKKAKNLNNLGIVYDCIGEYTKAIDSYQKALKLYRRSESDKYLLAPLHNLGITYRKLGHYARALELFNEALELARELRDRKEEALNLNSIGVMYESIGMYDASFGCYQKALEIFRQIHHTHEEARQLMNIGVYYRIAGNLAESLEFLDQSLDKWQEIEDQDGLGQCLNELGLTHLALKDYILSEECLVKAKDIAFRVKNQGFEAKTFKNLASLKLAQKDFDNALVFIDDAIELAELIREPSWEYHHLKATILEKLGNKKEYGEEMKLAHESVKQLLKNFRDDSYKEHFLNLPGIIAIKKFNREGY